MTTRVRIATMLVGAAVTVYGVWLLLGLGWANTRSTAFWLIGGVVLHDGIFAPITIVLGLIALRVLERKLLAPVVVGLVVLVPVTLLAIPELGRFGARADRPTLLDRHYWVGWFVFAAVVVVGVLVGLALAARREGHTAADATETAAATAGESPQRGGDDDDPGPGGR